MQVFDTKSEDISLSYKLIRGEEQIPDNHRLSKKILFCYSKYITSYFSFYQPLVAEKNEDITSFSLLCNQLEQQKVFEINISNLEYPQKKFFLFVNALKKNKSLKILTLADSNPHWDKFDKLYLSLEQMPLEELRLKENVLTNEIFEDWEYLCEENEITAWLSLNKALMNNTSLKILELSDKQLTDTGLTQLCSSIKNKPLEELSLSSNEFTFRAMLPFKRALETNTSLNVLDLSDNHLEDKGLAILCPIFKNMPLEKLILSHTRITDDSMLPLKRVLETSRTLKVLDLSRNRIKDKGLAILCPIFKNMPLEKLILSHIKITDDSMLLLKKIFEISTSLKVLDLSRNSIKDKGFAILCPIFENMPFEKLSLSHTNITDDSMLLLKRALETNTSLRVLNLSGNLIRDKGLATLCPVLKNMPLEMLDFASNRIKNIPSEFYSFLKDSSTKMVLLRCNALTEKSIKGIVLALKDNIHIKCLSGISRNKKLLSTFYPLMDLLTSLGQWPGTKESKNDLCISTKNFPRSLKVLNAAFEAHIQVVDLVDIIFSYTFNIDTLSDLHCLPRNV